MKKLLFLAAIAFYFSSCSKIVYTTTPRDEAKAMVNHFRTSTDVSHDFNDQIKQFMISAKAMKKISDAGDKLYYVLAAYIKDHPSGDEYREKNKFTVLIYVTDKDNKTKEVVDVRDILKKVKNKKPHTLAAEKDGCVCPPPDCINECPIEF